MTGACTPARRNAGQEYSSAELGGVSLRQPEEASLTWGELRALAGEADVVLLGETHDSAVDHAFQLEFLRWMMNEHPGTALSMEQLERNEQPIVDEYLAGKIDAATFIEKTGSADWAGKGSWVKWYQPLVDTAREHGASVVAANSPRQYSRAAYKAGLASLRELPAEEQGLFALPLLVDDTAYRAAFAKSMADHPGITPEMIDGMYAGQQVWDATMADSIVRAYQKNPKVVHTVGHFHVEMEGGLVSQILAREPRLVVLVLLPNASTRRADFKVYRTPSGV